ncbi:glycosyl transferase group 1 [Pseudobacteroides cellulosolvens ATCC 35603 = DSM 2933]|uniref:Glycosyl transferase group 1 n=2 Tax=Pseudobacteroides cellulosolvens TaxID=35825 RepID=A0A0L6JN85_9FIRM|nr:glycosyl transferase group 1 [Pseudobacteroides cellulosolvens ATCC 35603 = DSM 2933]
MIMNYYRNIDRSKVQFDFLVHYNEPGAYDEEIIRLGGKIFIMPKTVPHNYFIYRKSLEHFFKEHSEYKIVHGHLTSTAFMYLKIAKKYGVKCCIAHAHNTNVPRNIKGFIEKESKKLMLKYTDRLFSCSDAAAKFYFGEKIINTRGYNVLNNAIDSSEFIYNEKDREMIRQVLELEGKFVIGHIGRFETQKNHKYLLNIFRKIVNRKSNSVLLLIGKGPLEEEVKQKVHEMKLDKNVIFMGVRSDIPLLLQGMDVFVLPSLYEGLGIVLIEAQAAGLKCFASSSIPSEAKITDLVTFISLENSTEYWADEILKYYNGYNRKNCQKEIEESGYEIKSEVSNLEEFYIKA